MNSLYVHLTQHTELLSKPLKPNFKRLLGMELATDVIYFALSSVIDNLFIYVIARDIGCEIKYFMY